MRRRLRVVFASLAAWSACAGCGSSAGQGAGDLNPTSQEMTALAALSPATLPPPPTDVSNRFSDDSGAAHLGQELFFDPSLSGRLLDSDNDGSPDTLGMLGQTGRVACSGCHLPNSGFVDTRSLGEAISLAAAWGLRKAPSLLDVGQEKLLMWDGRKDALYNQVFGPIESPLEMNSSRLFVAEVLATKYRSEYEPIFGTMPAFDDPTQFPALSADLTGCTPNAALTPTCSGTTHGMPGDHAEYDGMTAAQQDAVTRAVVNAGKAVAAYERKLACGPSRFDQWMHGSASALSASEIRGALLFIGKGQCSSCHSGPYLSDQKFHNVGLAPVQVNFSAPADTGDQGAIVGIAEAIANPLNTLGPYSDGTDGRLPQAATPAEAGAFKTPMLRCAADRPSFMHTAQIKTLAEVVAFFNQGGAFPEFGTSELSPLGMSADEEQDLVNFLLALSGPGPDASLLAAPSP